MSDTRRSFLRSCMKHDRETGAETEAWSGSRGWASAVGRWRLQGLEMGPIRMVTIAHGAVF